MERTLYLSIIETEIIKDCVKGNNMKKLSTVHTSAKSERERAASSLWSSLNEAGKYSEKIDMYIQNSKNTLDKDDYVDEYEMKHLLQIIDAFERRMKDVQKEYDRFLDAPEDDE